VVEMVEMFSEKLLWGGFGVTKGARVRMRDDSYLLHFLEKTSPPSPPPTLNSLIIRDVVVVEIPLDHLHHISTISTPKTRFKKHTTPFLSSLAHTGETSPELFMGVPP